MDDLINFLRARETDREAAAQADLADPSSLHSRRKRAEWTLADVAAKRRIIRGYEIYTEAAIDGRHSDEYEHKADGLRYAVEALALPYVDHPDYRREWCPLRLVMTNADPEPPPMTTVENSGGERWTRQFDMWPGSWTMDESDGEGDPETWRRVGQNPVRVIDWGDDINDS